jgi:enolase-phosphatase E1
LPLGLHRAWLLDIEGTITSISFVHDVLFPYAWQRMEDFLRRNWDSPEVRKDVAALRRERAAEAAHTPAPTWDDRDSAAEQASAAAYARWLIDRDRKSTPLKSLQGKIWEAAYASGELRADVFPDVPPALRRWRTRGERVAFFSSGSVLAQKLLLSHTVAGDLTPLLDGYFDTTTGPKAAPESYEKIARALGQQPAAVVFVSDVEAELDAAGQAGLATVFCNRAGKAVAQKSLHHRIETFDELP